MLHFTLLLIVVVMSELSLISDVIQILYLFNLNYVKS